MILSQRFQGQTESNKKGKNIVQPNNQSAYDHLLAANKSFRIAFAVAADSPIPTESWNEYGRIMQLQNRVLDAIKPKGTPTSVLTAKK